MDHISVEVAPDHIESLTKARKPIIAVEELIWNALDADATEIDVRFTQNQLEGLERVTVSDNGHGIHRDKWRNAFGTLGGSPKLNMKTTPKGRRPHGKSGRGRFRAFGLGSTVTWRSRYQANGKCLQFEIVGRLAAIREFDASDATPTADGKPGVTVEISEIEKSFPSLLDREAASLELARRLALYLRQYPGIAIRYEGRSVDPKAMEEHAATYRLTIELPSNESVSAELTVIEWKCPIERAVYLCDQDGFAHDEHLPAIQAKGYNFTAYRLPFRTRRDCRNLPRYGRQPRAGQRPSRLRERAAQSGYPRVF